MPSMIRRIRIRLPTYLSIGLGTFAVISSYWISNTVEHFFCNTLCVPTTSIRASNAFPIFGKLKYLSKCKRLHGTLSATFASTPRRRDQKPGDDQTDRGHIAEASIDRRRDGSWQPRVQHAFKAEIEPRDDAADRIDHC